MFTDVAAANAAVAADELDVRDGAATHIVAADAVRVEFTVACENLPIDDAAAKTSPHHGEMHTGGDGDHAGTDALVAVFYQAAPAAAFDFVAQSEWRQCEQSPHFERTFVVTYAAGASVQLSLYDIGAENDHIHERDRIGTVVVGVDDLKRRRDKKRRKLASSQKKASMKSRKNSKKAGLSNEEEAADQAAVAAAAAAAAAESSSFEQTFRLTHSTDKHKKRLLKKAKSTLTLSFRILDDDE
jgi:hypothetical protein